MDEDALRGAADDHAPQAAASTTKPKERQHRKRENQKTDEVRKRKKEKKGAAEGPERRKHKHKSTTGVRGKERAGNTTGHEQIHDSPDINRASVTRTVVDVGGVGATTAPTQQHKYGRSLPKRADGKNREKTTATAAVGTRGSTAGEGAEDPVVDPPAQRNKSGRTIPILVDQHDQGGRSTGTTRGGSSGGAAATDPPTAPDSGPWRRDELAALPTPSWLPKGWEKHASEDTKTVAQQAVQMEGMCKVGRRCMVEVEVDVQGILAGT